MDSCAGLGSPPARALLAGPDARRACAAADRWFAPLCEGDGRTWPPVAHVGGGDAGIAVALAHWALRHGDEVERVVATRITRATMLSRALPMPWDLYGGWAGIGWAIDLLDAAEPELLETIDGRVHAAIVQAPDPSTTIVDGLAGVLLYAVQRAHGVPSALVTETVDRLLATVEPRAGGTTWPTRHSHLPPWLRAQHPRGHDNLGTAHGSPGIVAALAQVLGADLLDLARTRRVESVLRSTCTWIRSLPSTATSRLPAWVVEDEAPETQIAWCYGDVGASLALLSAARATGDARTEQFALELAHAAIPRVERWDGGELGLCHGHAGVTHIYHRLWRATGDEAFATVAREGCQRLCAVDDADGSANGDGLIEGRAGVALVLECACDDVAPCWDVILGCTLA